jgi:cytochrome P450
MTIADRCPVRDLEILTAPVIEQDPFEWLLQVREADPFWTESDGGMWLVTRYDQCREVQQDYRTFTHADSPYKLPDPLMPSDFDPPHQTKLRSIVLPLMTAERIDPLEPRMHDVCRELIDGFKDRGECDAIEEFARRYPIAIFGELFGLESDRLQEFRKLAETFLHVRESRAEAWVAIRSIIKSELEARRGAGRGDMLSGIANGQIDGEVVDIETATNLASTVFLGGLDTLPSNIGWTLRYLADNPDQRRRIVDDPSCVPGAVEEFFRRFPSVTRNPTRATRDVEFHGANIRKGDVVTTVLFLANCDSAVFDDPLTLDFGRAVNKHIAFSAGSHRCLGSHLARHELAVGLQEWHAAIPDYRIIDRDKITYTGGVAGMRYLHPEWEVPRR